MLRILLSLAGACALWLAGSRSARALPTGTTFEVFLDGGPSQTHMGQLRFTPSMSVPGGACRYSMQWTADLIEERQVTCWVDEATWHGFGSCVANATAIVRSIVMRAPNQPCKGLDGTRALDIFQLVLSERAGAPSLVGILQFTAASGSVYGVLAYESS